MTKEEIDKWLNEEYGCSYTRLEELHDFYFERYCDLRDRINKAIEILKLCNSKCAKETIEILKGKQPKNTPLDSDIALILMELEKWLEKEPGYKPVLTKLNELKADYKERYLDNE